MTENRRLLLVAAAVFIVFAIPVVGYLLSGKGPTVPRDVMEAAGMPPQSSGVGTGPRQVNQARLFHATEVDGARIVAADSEPGNWLAHGRTYSGQRYSPLDKINAGNVKDLGLAWSYDTDTVRGLESTPIVVDGVMFATGSWSVVYALDAKTGEELWKYDPEVPGEWGRKPCCDVVNRGVAVWKGRVYVGTLDGRLVALDAKTGKPVWDINTIDRTKPYSITGAPIVVKGKVIIGNGGAEYGVRGYVTAYDADTGRQLWRFYTVPGDPRAPVENPELKEAMATWKDDPRAPYRYWEVGGGGTVWDSFSYDPDLDLIYFGTGNATAWNRAVRSPGGGDNLFTASIMAVKADTGEVAWHFQTTASDNWDFDADQDLTLADVEVNGQPRKVVIQANKNGFLYVLDRQTGEFLSGTAFVPVNWASGLDAKGRAIENSSALYANRLALVMPAPAGGHNWQPVSYNPDTKILYIPAQDSAQPFVGSRSTDIKLGGWNTGVDFGAIAKVAESAAAAGQAPPPRVGELLAWDVVNKKELWRVKHPTFWNGGTLVTAGNVVFQGLGDGTFNAWSADKGDKLWSFNAHTGIIAPPMTYTVDGEQYVVVSAGWGGAQVSFGPDPAAPISQYGNNGKILAFKIGANTPFNLPKIEPPAMVQPPADTASADLIAHGNQVFHRNCAVCHGFLTMSGGVLPDLKASAPEILSRYKEIVLGGELKDRGMASFADLLKPEDVDAIHAYIVHMANIVYRQINHLPEPAPAKPAKPAKPRRHGR
ncbi:MAG: PQQ-dependent dehydrogenase, methanol/ethanol family [Alphaproteobacteria bacterium]|nr:PQQ-dependent dehydrogenase, methanol/ethanol family [Alphaproteobacteria bacterium]